MKRRMMVLTIAAALVAPGIAFGADKAKEQAEVKKAALNNFINSGWEFGGQATAAAKSADKGSAYQGAVAVSPGVWIYQVTDKGLALELTAKGTKYYKDGDLN